MNAENGDREGDDVAEGIEDRIARTRPLAGDAFRMLTLLRGVLYLVLAGQITSAGAGPP